MGFYRALLHLFPRSFRAEYGGEMMKDFARDWAAASGPGCLAVLAYAIADVMANAARVHLDILRQDVSYSLRSLRRTPGFTITAILVAAIGIGATTATFSLADHVLVRALPFPESQELVKIWEDHTARGYPRLEPSPPNLRDGQRQQTVFEHLEAFVSSGANMTGSGEARPWRAIRVDPITATRSD